MPVTRKEQTMNRFHSIALFTFVVLAFASCNKDCYDKALEEQYQTILCTQDCPGITGCDGKEYCNECIANSHGIRVE